MADLAVLMPYRNAGDTLDEALGSLLAEPFDGDVLAIDDGSTDDGPARVAAWAGRDGRVHSLASAGRGIVPALSAGLAATRAPLVARMDADDVSLPNRIARTRALLDRAPEIALASCAVRAFPEDAVREGMQRYVAWQNAIVTPADHRREIFVEAPLCHPTMIVRREALEAVGGFVDVPWAEDWDLWLRLDAAGYAMAKTPEVLYAWRHLPTRLTFNDARYAKARMIDARAHHLAPRLAGREVVVWGAGPTGRALSRALSTRGVTIRAFIDIDPRKIGRRARGAPILDPETALADLRGARIVVSVAARGARELVRDALSRRGLEEPRDFVCAA